MRKDKRNKLIISISVIVVLITAGLLLCEKLRMLGAKNVVLTGVSYDSAYTGVTVYSSM